MRTGSSCVLKEGTSSNFQNRRESSNKSTIQPHWFFKCVVEEKELWRGFSFEDSAAIEEAYSQCTGERDLVVPTGGGIYDVHINQRERRAVYWDMAPNDVRRGTWYYEVDGRHHPYDEEMAELIEEMYQSASNDENWTRTVVLDDEKRIVMENPQSLLHYTRNTNERHTEVVRRKVTRGLPANSDILPHEVQEVDHLVFVVEGVGTYSDLSFRNVIQCVDIFRDLSNRFIPLHFKTEVQDETIHRIEFLPIMWHESVRNGGINSALTPLNLPSIPKFRCFTADYFLDILLYTSPLYFQTIIDIVANELNRLHNLFLLRNPDFKGKVSVIGHSLGSLILFDILANQPLLGNLQVSKTQPEGKAHEDTTCLDEILKEMDLEELLPLFLREKIDHQSLLLCNDVDFKELNIPLGPRKKLLNYIYNHRLKAFSNTCTWSSSDHYNHTYSGIYPWGVPHNASHVTPRLQFQLEHFFALGSPISMFLVARGFSAISKDFSFPTCRFFFNLFHPYDPVAFRIETAIDSNFPFPPVMIPHHTGKKRLHIVVKERLTRFQSELREKFLKRFKFPSVDWISGAESSEDDIASHETTSDSDENMAASSGSNARIGMLNQGRRIDYVLQEHPIETLSDYVFAVISHTRYWNSEDTVLMILKEFYCPEDSAYV